MSYKWHPENFKAKLDKKLIGNLWRAGFLVEADAKRLCPVDTGRLRASLITRVNEATFSARVGSSVELLESPVASGIVGTDVDYGIYVEMGTYKTTPRPFLTPALETNKQEILRLMRGM
jgi:HK97 gp10 family phage protein